MGVGRRPDGGLLAELLELLLEGSLTREMAFDALCRHVDTRIGDCRASITKFDLQTQTLSMVAGPALAESYRTSVTESPVGDFGACSRAAWLGAPSICCDVFADSHFAGLERLCERYDFGAAWSFPIFDVAGDVVGTLGLYFSGRKRAPTDRERDFLHRMTQVARVILAHGHAPPEGERAMRQLVEQGRDVLIAVDAAHQVTYAAPSVDSVLGVSRCEVYARQLTDLCASADRRRLATFLDRIIAGGGAAILEDLRIEKESQDPGVFRVSGAPLHDSAGSIRGVTMALQEVTERRKLERRLRFAERMSSVGALSAGIAHEINNPLAFLQANVQYVREELQRGERAGVQELTAALDDALDGVHRVATIVQDLKTFARGESSRRDPVALRPVVDMALRMARPEVSKVASVEVDVPRDLVVLGDDTHLGQVIVNLVLNAAQAFPEDAPATHLIEVLARREGDGAVLEVRDNGPGVEPAIRKRIFEPFFTTKAMDRGSGLGLALVHGIVQSMGGYLDLETEVGAGACFRVHLRLAGEGRARAAGAHLTPQMRTVTPRILFVDDEIALGRALRRLLRGAFEVIYATSAEEALDILGRDAAFELCVLDVMMPEVDGLSLAGMIRERHPQLGERIAFLTGGIDGERRALAARAGWRHFMKKPISREAFESLFERVVNAGQVPAPPAHAP